MLTIPEKYAENIKQIIEWHLETYVPEIIFDTRIKRILEQLGKESIVQLEDNELYFLNECVANAKTNAPECGVEKNIVDEIFDWIYPEYRKTKQS